MLDCCCVLGFEISGYKQKSYKSRGVERFCHEGVHGYALDL